MELRMAVAKMAVLPCPDWAWRSMFFPSSKGCRKGGREGGREGRGR